MATRDRDEMVTRALAKKLEVVGWGLFFIWIGIAFLADLRWGVGFVGVGVIAVGTQVARKYFGLPIERFGLVVGIAFVVWGLWALLSIELGKGRISGSVLPILCIVLGIVFVVSALLRKTRG